MTEEEKKIESTPPLSPTTTNVDLNTLTSSLIYGNLANLPKDTTLSQVISGENIYGIVMYDLSPELGLLSESSGHTLLVSSVIGITKTDGSLVIAAEVFEQEKVAEQLHLADALKPDYKGPCFGFGTVTGEKTMVLIELRIVGNAELFTLFMTIKAIQQCLLSIHKEYTKAMGDKAIVVEKSLVHITDYMFYFIITNPRRSRRYILFKKLKRETGVQNLDTIVFAFTSNAILAYIDRVFITNMNVTPPPPPLQQEQEQPIETEGKDKDKEKGKGKEKEKRKMVGGLLLMPTKVEHTVDLFPGDTRVLQSAVQLFYELTQ